MAPRVSGLEQNVFRESLVHIDGQAVVLGISQRLVRGDWQGETRGQEWVSEVGITLGRQLRQRQGKSINRSLCRLREEQRQIVIGCHNGIAIDLRLEQ